MKIYKRGPSDLCALSENKHMHSFNIKGKKDLQFSGRMIIKVKFIVLNNALVGLYKSLHGCSKKHEL